MEEKILVQSEQYNVKKFVKILCSLVVVLSIIACIVIYAGYYFKHLDEAKRNYEFTSSKYEEYEEHAGEYDSIIKAFETTDKQNIYCGHTEYEYYGTYDGHITGSDVVPFTKEEFIEKHSSSESYLRCKYELPIIYDSFDEYVKYNKVEIQSYEKRISMVPLIANLAIPLIILFYLWMHSYSLTITDKRVYGKTSFGKRVDLPLDSVSSVGTSALKGVAVGTSSGKIKFKLIKNQKDIHEVISKLLAERQTIEKVPVETTVQQTIVETSAADEIKKFKELLDMGAITQEEFDAKKKELLGL